MSNLPREHQTLKNRSDRRNQKTQHEAETVYEYNFEDRHGNTLLMSFEDIKRMLNDDPDDGRPPGLWAQDPEAYEAKERAQREINQDGFK